MLVEYMESTKKINAIEKAILECLIRLGSMQLLRGWDRNLLVQKMDDGGMGSFLIFQEPSDFGETRKFGKQVSEFEFIDDDGIPVLVSLNVDDKNRLFEVDIWKADYKPVINFKLPTNCP